MQGWQDAKYYQFFIYVQVLREEPEFKSDFIKILSVCTLMLY